MNRIALCLLALSGLAACTYPTATVGGIDATPHLFVAGAPQGSTLEVDGNVVGDASRYAPGKTALAVSSGTHRVTVNANGRTLLDTSVYFGSGADQIVSIAQ